MRHRPDETREEIAIFEDDEKENGLHHAKPAEPGSGLVETADERFPKKDEKAGGADGSAQLRVGKIDEEETTAENNDPRTKIRARNAKKNGGGKEKEKVVVPGIKNHGTGSARLSCTVATPVSQFL